MSTPVMHAPSTETHAAPYIEPWMSGTRGDVPAVGRAVLHALDLALDDLTKWTEGLTDLEVHTLPLGLPPVAFHLRHIAALDRPPADLCGGQPAFIRTVAVAEGRACGAGTR